MRKIKNTSLKKQIIRSLTLFLISVIVVIGVLSISNIYNAKIDSIKFNQNLVLKQVNDRVDSLINNIEYLSIYIENKIELKNRNIAFNNILETNKDISSILILNNNGILEEIYVKNKEKQNIYKGFDYSNKEYYKKLKDKKNYWSNVFLSSLDETPTISYSFKIKNKIGVILIDLTEISNFILKFKNQDDSYMVRIFDRNGVLIMDPTNIQLVLQRFNASSSEIFTKLIDIKEVNEEAIYYSILDNEEQYGAYLKNEKTNWNIVVRENYNNILKSLNNIIFLYMGSMFLFMILGIYLAFKISKNIFSSFNKIHAVTSKIAYGDYETKIEGSDFQEFNKLLDSFYKMQIEIDKREESLEKSLNSFKSLFNSTMECVVLSKGHEIVDVNDVTVKLFGFKSKNDAIGKNVLDYIVDDYKELVSENFKKNVNVPYEVEFIKEEGEIFHALVQGKFLELDNEKIRVSALIDITELKNKDRLLYQQTKMASMGEMIGNIAHQWRQPLNVISTSASSVKLEKEFGVLDDKQLGESMDMIVQNALYLSKTIDDFRNFFQTDKSLEIFEVRTVVEKALKLIQASIKNHNIIIKKSFLDEMFSVEGYPNEFIQVLINMFNNSKDAFISNQIQHRVIEIKEELYDDCYKLRIVDNAGGIPDNILYKIFDPYFTTKHKSQGTGIGLYMSHQIITDHMKGNLYVKNINYKYENTNYRGCSFTIKLPRESAHNYIYEI
ncbi:ATP-binding protein [Halarcobacter sp.]|uniref:ATP-binding protein n=1 Tax=Halarcobacter sp. TaxID=2321133 RepID=UPI002AABAB6D|nr:cache domain-containing protein [Halarcobacter sp.]